MSHFTHGNVDAARLNRRGCLSMFPVQKLALGEAKLQAAKSRGLERLGREPTAERLLAFSRMLAKASDLQGPSLTSALQSKERSFGLSKLQILNRVFRLTEKSHFA